MTFQLFYYSQLTFDNSAKPIQREKKSDIGITGSIQFSSVALSCPTLCNPMNCSTLGLLVHHQLPEFTQTHIQEYIISRDVKKPK